LPGHVLVKAFAPVFFARQDTWTPMRAALIGLVVALLGSLALRPILGHVGVAIAIAISGWVTAGVLGFWITTRFGFALDAEARRRLPRIGLAAGAMGVALVAARTSLTPWLAGTGGGQLLALAGLIGGGTAVYFGLLHLFGVARLRALAAGMRRPL
jgi:putative peptidoglycan lipid II flippase